MGFAQLRAVGTRDFLARARQDVDPTRATPAALCARAVAGSVIGKASPLEKGAVVLLLSGARTTRFHRCFMLRRVTAPSSAGVGTSGLLWLPVPSRESRGSLVRLTLTVGQAFGLHFRNKAARGCACGRASSVWVTP